MWCHTVENNQLKETRRTGTYRSFDLGDTSWDLANLRGRSVDRASNTQQRDIVAFGAQKGFKFAIDIPNHTRFPSQPSSRDRLRIRRRKGQVGCYGVRNPRTDWKYVMRQN
ncbi:hypothetical protein WA026_003869 [Henosepilachna vigintioctopunctata]|uniref:Uncharacterized protein n=1 Tax=Henosepilachna vigintioctopunctata TaxID=420089 RepID=A0AAW1UEH9_9CUCU